MVAELIVVNGRIFRADGSSLCLGEFAIGHGRFLRVGMPGCTRGLAGPGTRIVDLEGDLVLPGLCDSHIHFANYARSLRNLDLHGMESLSQSMAALSAAAENGAESEWIVGHGWDQNIWKENRFPTSEDLDGAAGLHKPVLLYAKSGHAAVASSAALRAAGLGKGDWSPEGGEVERTEDGSPSGLLLENPAINLVAGVVPEVSDRAQLDMARQAQLQLHAWGITSIHDFDGRLGLETLQAMAQRNELRLRAVSHIALDQLDSAVEFGIRGPLAGPWLKIGGLKMFADGALGPRTALMIAPYEGEPGNFGMSVTDKEDLLERGLLAARHGIACAVHAIGDRANHDVLDVMAELRRVESEMGVAPARRRHRIEHVQVIQAEDIPRLRELQVSAAVQPIHATQDKDLVDTYWGDRGSTAYAFQTLLEEGVRMSFGSDAPVESPNPYWGMFAGLTRRRRDEDEEDPGWYPDQKLSRTQLIHGYTREAAFLEGWENEIGTIETGYRADFFVPDRDLFACAASELAEAESRWTVAGGETVHKS